MNHPHLDRVPSWFVVLPDCPAAEPAAAALRSRATCVIRHPSGRTWLLGRWADEQAAVATCGDTAIAVIGEHLLSAADLAHRAARVADLADLDQPARCWAGNFHLIASVAGRVRVQGPVSGFRRVFHAGVDGVTVAADRADVLAGLTGAALDEARLAVMLLEPGAPHPIGGEPMWRGLAAVPTGCYLAIDRTGRHRPVRWWTPPRPEVPMSEGAPAFRAALSAAVEVRTRGRELVSTDLGGFDTTSLCCLAAGGPAHVAAYTWAPLDPAADDAYWARKTVAALGAVEHHVVPSERTPFAFSGIGERDDVALDEPCAITLDRRWLVIADRAAARGSRLHLTGFGGDQVLGGSPAHLHTLLRKHPRTALRNLRGYTALNRWPYWTSLRQLLDNRSYREWLLQFGADLTADPVSSLGPSFYWAKPVRLPPWATPDAAAAVRDLIRRAAPTTEPLGHGHGQHQEIADLGGLARMTRNLGQLARQRGIALAAPYFDDRVIEAGLAVRPRERVTPWRFKALAVEAMRGIVPDETLARQTKAIGSHEVEVGFRANRAEILALCEDSRLGRLGVIDAAALREVCGRPLPTRLEFHALYPTLACEIWLRALERNTVPT
ncbi:MAG TPA: asparagine synthase-related protein [Actinophytocola sp.]|uniref:asparagine synthase-related protein n=1 Tax=Actinophytocola sp. TaxID=1872138 RepID=UPI002DDD9889|nr:asparagine synthase-related protein [Actinophytocola sp.]HEV2784070.1 asparagine synthase-related protein [Actinophytocola sp.]